MENGRNWQLSNIQDIYGLTGRQSPAVNHMANCPIRRRACSRCQGIINESLMTGPAEMLLAVGISILAIKWRVDRRWQKTLAQRRHSVSTCWSFQLLWLQHNAKYHTCLKCSNWVQKPELYVAIPGLWLKRDHYTSAATEQLFSHDALIIKPHYAQISNKLLPSLVSEMQFVTW